jgi:ATP-binding cassette subfamily F protein 3
METIDALIKALGKFGGGALLVSHDQYFLSSIGKEFWSVSNGQVRRFHTFQETRKFTYSVGF